MSPRRPVPRTGSFPAGGRPAVGRAALAPLALALQFLAATVGATPSPGAASTAPAPRTRPEALHRESVSPKPARPVVAPAASIRPAPAAPVVEELAGAGPSRAGFVLPRSAHRGGPVPLVVWLHGGIGADNPAKGVVAAQGFAVWADTGRFALLCPSAWPSSPWWTEDAARRVIPLVRTAMSRRGVDHRLVIAGASDGGAGAFWLAARLRAEFGDTLRAVAVWSCSADLLAAVGAAWDPRRLAGLPLRWTQGDRDRLFGIDDVRRQWRALQQAGVLVEGRVAAGAGHDLAEHGQDLAHLPQWLHGLR